MISVPPATRRRSAAAATSTVRMPRRATRHRRRPPAQPRRRVPATATRWPVTAPSTACTRRRSRAHAPPTAGGSAGASAAGSPTDAQRAEAQKLMDEGVKLLKARKYEAAIERFEAGYKLVPSPNFLLNKAAALRDMGRHAEAVVAYEQYLANPGDRPRVDEARKAMEERARTWAAAPTPRPTSPRPSASPKKARRRTARAATRMRTTHGARPTSATRSRRSCTARRRAWSSWAPTTRPPGCSASTRPPTRSPATRPRSARAPIGGSSGPARSRSLPAARPAAWSGWRAATSCCVHTATTKRSPPTTRAS